MKLGSKVKVQDKWDNQTATPHGTVIEIKKNESDREMCYVVWDDGNLNDYYFTDKEIETVKE